MTDLNGSNGVVEEDLKTTYFDKWKQEEADAEQTFRNQRYALRNELNGGFNVK